MEVPHCLAKMSRSAGVSSEKYCLKSIPLLHQTMNTKSTLFDDKGGFQSGMSLKLIRIARLKQFAASRGLHGPSGLGAAIGKKSNQTSDLLSGKASFGEKVARSIEEHAGLPQLWLDTIDDEGNTEPGPNIRGAVPVLTEVQAGMYKEFVDNSHPGDGTLESVATSVKVNQHTFALRVIGDSMEPRFVAGTILIVEPELDPLPGDFVIAKNGGEETTFKQLIRDAGIWYLKALNARYPIRELGNSVIIGVVRAAQQSLR